MTDSSALRRAEVAKFFVDENLEGDPKDITSPSGRYRLTIRTYRTLPGRWSYSRGTVTRVADGATVCDIQRNLGSFHHSFVTKDGREFLISGRSYMSQTIVDLDRGQEFEPSGDQYNGNAFCWAKCFLSPDGNTLAVDGCIWACPYEFRFFDFSDPSKGWPELRLVGADRIEYPSDKRDPAWLDALTFECFQWDSDNEPQERTRVQRRGSEIAIVDHWVSEAEQTRRDNEARAEAEQDAWWESFRSSNPMYLRLVELVRARRLPCENLEWQPGGRRITLYFRRQQPHASADLRWDTEAGTLEVRPYAPHGDQEADVSFEHNLAGIENAITFIAERFR